MEVGYGRSDVAVCWWGSDVERYGMLLLQLIANQQRQGMGNGESKNLQEQKFISDHSSFNDAKVVSDKDAKWIQAKFKVQNEQYDQWHKGLESGKSRLTSDYLLLPDKTNFKHDQGLCGNTGTLTNNYPYHPFLLSQLIKQRQADQKLFKESELWYVLYALAAARQDIQEHSKKLGDVKPDNIFVNEDGRVKIANVYSWPNQNPSFVKALDQDILGYSGLLAPEDFPLLQKGAFENDANEHSETFAIGATVLSAGILNNLESVYNYKAKIFSVPAFKEYRQTWGETQKYSAIFKAIVLNLTEANPSDRLTAAELWEWISQYKDSILEKKQFVIASAPAKVEKSFQALRAKIY